MNAWDVFWLLFVFIPLCFLWGITLVDMMGRGDLFGWQKALWAMVIIFFPWIGVFAYLVARPRALPFPSYVARSMPEAATHAPQGAPTTPQPSPTAVPSPVSADAQRAMS